MAFHLKEMVDYAPGAVVSRTLVKNSAGTITLFSFDAGQGLSTHSAPFDAVVMILDGAAELTIGEDVVRPIAGQVVLMPANVPHAVQAGEPFKMLLVMLRGS
jgi:quercetin dioxygenase-like cupin family protein